MTHANTSDATAVGDTLEIHPRVLTGAFVTGLIIAIVVGAASFKLSFSTLLDLATMAGIDPSDAWVIPVALDGPILAAAVIRIALSQHSDPITRRGRKLVVAVLAACAALSIAGNAYHAVLTATYLNVAVAAAIAALAPAMVLTMSEIVAVVLRAPRLRVTTLSTDRTDLHENVDAMHYPVQQDTDDAAGDLYDGQLKPEVWATAKVFLTQDDWNYSQIADHLGINKSTVSRHLTKWADLQRSIADELSAPLVAAAPSDGTSMSTPVENATETSTRELAEVTR